MILLSLGGGIQTTALVILVAKRKVKADLVIFSDTGGEKPETYWYIENYIKEILDGVAPFKIVKSELKSTQPDLYGWLWKFGQIPPIGGRRLCSIKFKREAIEAQLKGIEHQTIIGFSLDEVGRAAKYPNNLHPLIDMRINAVDCCNIITDYGLPVPLKSSCYFCPYQHPVEWNWLKTHHPDLFDKALELEAHYHERRPDMINFGLVRGVPLRNFKEGIQPEMFANIGNSCWSGYCGH